MRPDFETGVLLGQTLERIKATEARIDDHDTRLTKVETKIATAESWIGRAITAGYLWAAGAGINLSAESVGQMIARVLR